MSTYISSQHEAKTRPRNLSCRFESATQSSSIQTKSDSDEKSPKNSGLPQEMTVNLDAMKQTLRFNN